MHEHFTNAAEMAMQLANQEAQRFDHEFIGTEHLLLGLVKEQTGAAASVLRSLNVDLGKIEQEIENLLQCGPDKVTLGKLSLTPRAKSVIDYAIQCATQEARNPNATVVGTQHLLLGVMHKQNSVAFHVLAHFGLTYERIREVAGHHQD